MTLFLTALAAFIVAHLVPSAPPVRRWLVALLGRPGYLAAYSVVSLALLAWVIVAARSTEDVALWDPAPWQWWVPFVVMPLAAFLVVAGLDEANPLSITLRRGEQLPAVAAITRHPVPWSLLLWAVAHIPANGRLVPVVLFATMAVLAAAGFPLLDRKARARLGDAEWTALAGRTSVLPFAALLAGRADRPATRPLLRAGAAAAALYAWFVLQGHALLIGPDPLAGLRSFF